MRCLPPSSSDQHVTPFSPRHRVDRRGWPRTATVGGLAVAIMLGLGALTGPGGAAQGEPLAVIMQASPPPGTPGNQVSPVAGTPSVPTSSPTPVSIPAPPATPTAFRSPLIDIEPVVWATALEPGTNRPRDTVSTYAAEAPAIYATFRLPHVRRGTTITATWAYNNTPIEGFTSSVTVEREEQNVWIEFHLTRSAAAAWPAGVYEIVVSVEGQTAQVATVTVAGR